MTASPGAAVPPETALTSAVPNFWLYRLEHERPQAALAAPATSTTAIPPTQAPPARTSPARPTTAFLIPYTIYLSFLRTGWPRYGSPEWQADHIPAGIASVCRI